MTIAEKYNNIDFNSANTEDPPITSFNFKKANTNDIAKLIYDEVNNNIQAAKKAGRIAANEDLNALGITAQILFETGYGKSELSSKYNNFGGLRADKNWKGQVVDMVNKQTKQSYQWRAYPTVSDGIKAQVDFYIDNGRYRKNGVFNAKTPQDHINAVAKAGYAGGESDYVKKVNTVLETLPKKLSNYDPNILKQWEEYKSQAASNPPIEYKQQASVYNIQAPSLPKIRPYFDKGLGLTTEIDKNHEIIQAMENANRSEYLEKQVDKIEKPLFEALLKPIKFAQGGNINPCSNGQIWNPITQSCVNPEEIIDENNVINSKYNPESYKKYQEYQIQYDIKMQELENAKKQNPELEAQYTAMQQKLKDEQSRVGKVRSNIIPTAKRIDIADDNILEKYVNTPFIENYYNAQNPTELKKAIANLPRDVKNVLPGKGQYNIAKWEGNKWNSELRPGRELYCTPYGCFAYQEAGAFDVPTIGGNIAFANRANKGTIPFEKINPNNREPGDMALLVEDSPVDYSRPELGNMRRPHHTTIYASPGENVNDTKEGNFYNASGGSRFSFGKQYFSTKRSKNDRIDYYRYVGQIPKLEKQLSELEKQRELQLKNIKELELQRPIPYLPTLNANSIKINSFAQGGDMQDPPDWLKWAQLKNPKLQVMPYYSNSMTGLLSPSLEIGASGTAGKKGRWTIRPHLGLGYQSNYKIPISGGLDAGFKGILSPDQRGNAFINVGAGFHPNQGLGIGFEGGYKYRLGQSNSRNNNLRVNKAALDLMPYAGWQVAARPENAELANVVAAQLSGSQNPESLKLAPGEDFHIGPIYGINAKAQWRPKLGMYSPLTFFAEGDLNFNPARGKYEEKVTSATSSDTYDSPTSGLLRFTPQFSGNIGAQIDFKTIKNSLKNSLPRNYSDDENIEPYINPQGDFTFEQIYDDNSNRMPSIWNTGISPNFNRMSLEAETPEEQFNWINDNTEQLQSYPYKYGGNFKNIFRNYRKK